MKNIAMIEFIYKSIVGVFDVSIIKALSLYPKSKHQFKEQVRHWLTSYGVPTKEYLSRCL